MSTRVMSFEREMSLQAHVFKHLVSAGGSGWEGSETLGGGASIQEVGHWGEALRFYSPDRLLASLSAY